jgi:hypothetical protein
MQYVRIGRYDFGDILVHEADRSACVDKSNGKPMAIQYQRVGRQQLSMENIRSYRRVVNHLQTTFVR